uniref:deoxyhypusine monooxygenase n=1 Tax=Canis lupus familiaris TaxID=9615 RepID=A0A8P0TMW9_CANLF
MVTEQEVEAIGRTLVDTRQPLQARFRALFTLRGLGGPGAIAWISRAFGDDSALLKHELAYCLGQMQDSRAIPVLVDVLRDARQEPMVRHEAGEALGAIGNPEVLDVLKQYCTDPVIEVAETCQLAVRRLEWLQEHSREPAVAAGPYLSVDPAPPAEEQDVGRLREVLLDEARPLFDRYRAMFALRDAGGEEAALALAEGEWGSGSRSVRLAQAPGRTRKWRNRVTRERASCPGARTPPRAFPEAGRHTCPHFPWGGRGQKGGESCLSRQRLAATELGSGPWECGSMT